MLPSADQPVFNVVCLPFGAGLVATCGVAADDQSSKAVGHESKTMSRTMLKCSVELRGTSESDDNFFVGLLQATPLTF